MKKKVITTVCILLSALLLIPIPLRLRDGGTVKYQAVLYSVSDVHRLTSTEKDVSLETGLIIKIIGIEVFNNVAIATERIANNSINISNQNADPMAYAFEAQYIRTDGYSEDRNYPFHVVINSREELEAYYEANKEVFDLERKEKVYSDTTIGFLDACDKYDDSYFERQNLVLIVLEEGSGSIRHEITDVRPHSNDNGALVGWDITIDRIVPEVGTDDMAQWHLLLEVQMGDVIKKEADVWINGKISGERAD